MSQIMLVINNKSHQPIPQARDSQESTITSGQAQVTSPFQKTGMTVTGGYAPQKQRQKILNSASIQDQKSVLESAKSSNRSYFGSSHVKGRTLGQELMTLQPGPGKKVRYGGGSVINEASADLPSIYQNMADKAVNFENFKHVSPKVVRPNQMKTINSISLGKSVEEWSSEIRETFCRGLVKDAAHQQSSQYDMSIYESKASRNPYFQFLTGEASVQNHFRLQQSSGVLAFDDSASQSAATGVNFQTLDEPSEAGGYKSAVNSQSFMLQSLGSNFDSYSQQQQSPSWNTKFRMFKQKQKQSVHQMLTERIGQQCQTKMDQQQNVTNLAAQRRCQMMGSTESFTNRQQLLKQVTTKALTVVEQQPKLTRRSPTKQKPAKYRRNRAYLQTEQPDDEQTLKKQEQQLWLRLHCGIERDLQTDQPLRAQLKRYQSIEDNQKIKESPVPEAFLKRKKYQQLGEHGEAYAKKDYEAYLELKKREKILLEAANSKHYEPWSYERIAGQHTKSKEDKISYVISRDKGVTSPQEQVMKSFESKVELYVNDLNQSKNLGFTVNKTQDGLALGRELSPLQRSPSNISPKGRQGSFRALPMSMKPSEPFSPSQRKFKRRNSNRQVNIGKLDSHIEKMEQPYKMEKLFDHLLDKLAFQQLCKESSDQPQTMQELLKDDPRQQYFSNCKKEVETARDLLNKISDKQLVLEEYSLQNGCCAGFMNACQIVPEIVTRVTIDNCSLGSKALSQFLKGLNYTKRTTQLCLKKIPLDLESAQQLSFLLDRLTPFNVDDLRIENCQLSIEGMTLVFKSILDSQSITKLAIVGQEFTQEHISLLSDFVQNSCHLVDLNLSYSRVPAIKFLPLLTQICENKRLVHINLSWVKLFKQSNFGAAQDMLTSIHKQKQESRRCSFDDSALLTQNSIRSSLLDTVNSRESKARPAQKYQRSEHDQAILDALINLLTTNEKLFHLDLSETGLTQDIICRIIKPVKHSQSLIGLHLSGNPGITKDTERRILQSLKATYEPALKLSSFQQVVDRGTEAERQDLRKKNHMDNKISEALYLKQLMTEKRLETHSKNLGDVNNPQSRHFILTRKLGHHLEIPGSSDWTLHKENYSQCYICDRKIYTVFFWSPTIGKIEGYDVGLTTDQQYRIANYVLQDRETDQLRQQRAMTVDKSLTQKLKTKVYNEKVGDFIDQSETESIQSDEDSFSSSSSQDLKKPQGKEAGPAYRKFFEADGPAVTMKLLPKPDEFLFAPVKSKETPYLYGTFNNWQPQPMIPVHKIAQALDQETPSDLLLKLQQQGMCRESVTCAKQMSKRERENYSTLVAQHNTRYTKDDVWTKALSNLIPYKNPHYACVANLKYVDTSTIHIGANFIGTGRQDFMVQHGSSFYFHQTIADFRKEEVVFPLLSKYEKGKVERNPNIFKNWQQETSDLLDQCVKYDSEYWKVPNFVKDSGDIDTISQVIRKEYTFLKEVFTIIAARSLSYPCASQIEFGNMMQEAGILDKTFTQGICDTQFIASRVDAEKKNNKTHGQTAHDINRFEFLECVIRVANIKYKQTGLAPTIGQSISMLVDQIRPQFKGHQTAQEFRKQELWTRNVNLTLDANKKAIQKLYDSCAKGKMRKLTIQEALQLMTKDTRIKLTDTDAYMCYAMSQQALPDLVKHSMLKISHLDFLEFLELIGRVADCHLGEEDSELYEKINRVLDEWLGIVGESRREPVQYEESGSELSQYNE